MNAFEFPGDDQIALWSGRYGATGVKTYELELQAENRGAVAVYRELTMSERQLLARLELLDEEYPDLYDYQRMIVAAALLYPAIDDYPHPSWAVSELFLRIRRHGQSPLHAEEAVTAGLPEHMIRDIRVARSAAQLVFEDDRFTSIYRDLVLNLAVSGARVDPIMLHELWRMPLGQLRDLMSIVEQTHHILYKQLSTDKRADPQMLATVFESPFAALDKETGGATVPGFVQEQEEEPSAPAPEATGLPPNRPPTKADFSRAFD